MNIQPTAAPGALATTIGTSTVPEARDDISADFTTFLTLLTAQLRSQDPLNPVDSTEFIAQLASFSAVEQQTRTNQLLGDFLSEASAESPGALVGLLGHEITAPIAVPWDGETPIAYQVTPEQGADRAQMVVYNEFGAPVARLNVDPRATSIVWDGQRSTGGAAEPGLYRAEITYAAGASTSPPVIASGPTTVREIRFQNGEPVLIVDGGTAIDPDAITSIGATD